jgi:hypothetical protein
MRFSRAVKRTLGKVKNMEQPMGVRVMSGFVSIGLMVIASLPSIGGQQEKTANQNSLLGFDPKQVRPPDPAKGKPLARVFDKYIHPADLKAKSVKLTQEQADRLSGRIIGPMFDRYASQNKIAATPKEIDDVNRAIHKAIDESGNALAKAQQSSPTKEQKQIENEVAAQVVKRWKLSKALYEEYGGLVIFQQGNPLEPVGAYRKFLEKMERGKVFEIYDEANRKMFWHYFTREHPFAVNPRDVDYSIPWWLKRPDSE